MSHNQLYRAINCSKDLLNKSIILILLSITLLNSTSLHAQNQKEIELIVECVQYVGNGK